MKRLPQPGIVSATTAFQKVGALPSGSAYRKFLGFLVPVGKEVALLLVDLKVRHLESDRLVRVAGEQQILHAVTARQTRKRAVSAYCVVWVTTKTTRARQKVNRKKKEIVICLGVVWLFWVRQS